MLGSGGCLGVYGKCLRCDLRAVGGCLGEINGRFNPKYELSLRLLDITRISWAMIHGPLLMGVR